jgi:hypothetical protein
MTKTKNAYLYSLRKLFNNQPVLDMQQVCMAVCTRSRTTGFRYLRELHHLTSYTHNGKYYTLPEIAQFDSNGFWYFEDIGFSIHGTLINTLHHAITQSATGKSSSELEKHCGTKIQAALRTLLYYAMKIERVCAMKIERQNAMKIERVCAMKIERQNAAKIESQSGTKLSMRTK